MKVAVTGHQNLGSSNIIKWVQLEILCEVEKLGIEQGYSCLAAGTDQLFADILVQKNIPLIAVIPSINYEETFNDEEHLIHYNTLLKKASKIIHMDFSEPSETAFFEASKMMVDQCQLLLAIWNNLPAKGLGGTADVVAYAKKENKRIVHLNLLTKTKKEL